MMLGANGGDETMMKASAGYRALAVADPEPTHVVPLARFGGGGMPTPQTAAPSGEKFSLFRDRAAAMPAGQPKPAPEAAKTAFGGDGVGERKGTPTLPKAETPSFGAAVASEPQAVPSDLSPWSRTETLPASVLFEGAGQNDVLRFLVDRFTLAKRKGDIFIHVRPIGAIDADAETVLSFVEPAKSSLGAELIATLIKARRAAGHDVTIIEPPASHDDAGFWQAFTQAS